LKLFLLNQAPLCVVGFLRYVISLKPKSFSWSRSYGYDIQTAWLDLKNSAFWR